MARSEIRYAHRQKIVHTATDFLQVMKATKRPPILRTSAAALLALLVLNPAPAKAVTITWTGATDNLWETATNWAPPLTPSSPLVGDIIFSGSNRTNTFNDAAGDILQSISFANTTSTFVLNGNAVAIQGGGFLSNYAQTPQIINFSNAGGAGGLPLLNASLFPVFAPNPIVTFNAAAGDLIVNCDVSFNAVIPGAPLTLVVTGAHNVIVNGSIFDTFGIAGSVLKTGSGALILTGHSTYQGSTTVNGGLLQVDGSITSPLTFVNPGGTLGGRGYIGGSVFNLGGNVAPGDSPGTLTVNGNYVQNHNGTLTVEVRGGDSGRHDTLAVQSHAVIDGNLRIVKLGKGPLLNVGDKIDVLTANSGVTGTFSDVSYQTDTIVNTKVVYKANKVVLETATGYFEKFARNENLTPNQIAVAQGLDKVATRNGEAKLVNFLDGELLTDLPGDFDKIAPEELTSIFTIGAALANVQTANLQRRTDDIRSGSHGFSASGFATAGSGPLYSGNMGVAGPNGNDGKESKETKSVVAPENRWGVFITGVGEWVGVTGDNNARGYDITTGGFTIGADYKLTPNFAVGLSAGYAGTGVDLTNGGRVFVNGGKVGLYATYFQNEPEAQAPTMSKDSKEVAPPASSMAQGFYVDLGVTGGLNSYDTRRDGLQGTARGSTDGGEFNALFGAGYDWKIGGFSIGPTASFQYTYLGLDDFTERGSLAPLSFRSQHQDSLRTALGLKASYDWRVGGVVVKPELRAAWQHEYGDSAYALDASFQNGGGNLFTVNGPEIGRDSLLLGAGFAILWSERTSTYVYYDGELGRERFDSHNVSGGIRVSF